MIDIYHIHNNKQVLRHITIHLESYKQLDHSQTDIRLTFFPQQSWKSIPFILFLGLNTGTPLYCQYQMHEDTHTPYDSVFLFSPDLVELLLLRQQIQVTPSWTTATKYNLSFLLALHLLKKLNQQIILWLSNRNPLYITL